METNNNKKIRSTTVPKIKWSDEAISKLCGRFIGTASRRKNVICFSNERAKRTR